MSCVVAQWVESLPHVQEVTGSSLALHVVPVGDGEGEGAEERGGEERD